MEPRVCGALAQWMDNKSKMGAGLGLWLGWAQYFLISDDARAPQPPQGYGPRVGESVAILSSL